MPRFTRAPIASTSVSVISDCSIFDARGLTACLPRTQTLTSMLAWSVATSKVSATVFAAASAVGTALSLVVACRFNVHWLSWWERP